jgi:hypothetical protein
MPRWTRKNNRRTQRFFGGAPAEGKEADEETKSDDNAVSLSHSNISNNGSTNNFADFIEWTSLMKNTPGKALAQGEARSQFSSYLWVIYIQLVGAAVKLANEGLGKVDMSDEEFYRKSLFETLCPILDFAKVKKFIMERLNVPATYANADQTFASSEKLYGIYSSIVREILEENKEEEENNNGPNVASTGATVGTPK